MLHDKENCRFTIPAPEGASYLEYKTESGTLTVLHTVVPPALGGRGIAASLAEAAAAYAEAEGLVLASDCSYMTAWMKRHPRRQPPIPAKSPL